MSDRIKSVTREGFETVTEARADAQRFIDIGGKVAEGGERADGLFGWSGTVRVEDTHTSVEGDFFCGRCAGTGQFITYVENGKPRGPGGECFRCNGKGFHNNADRRRNWGYDMHAFAREARRMMGSA
ncbi:unnamed protein product [marine sediment metagenome]|uniref:Uncharacterized protein n=1 Tax=marine sediment metagenome TaxID=412755 RepID=X0UCE2_9ZZZZ